MARKVILDVDTGFDDSIAIMAALLCPDLDVIGICSVNGNRGIEYTTENTLRIVEHLGSKVPVYKGCALPLVATLPKWRRPMVPFLGQEDTSLNVHDDYVPLPKATIKEQKQDAVTWLVDTLLASDGDITLIPVGPLTNVAAAIRICPDIVPKIHEIIYMGAGYKVNNITAGAEFNVWIDPEAAKIVIDSGVKITLVPLDATHRACIRLDECKKLREVGTKVSKTAAEIIEFRIRGYSLWQPMERPDEAPVHDALAVAYAVDPLVLKSIHHAWCDVDISGGPGDGMTVVDVEKRHPDKAPNCYCAIDADRDRFADWLLKQLSRNV